MQLLNRHRLFWLGLLAIWLLSLGLRFWGLSRFNTLVFDEVYFARFGNDYVANRPFFDAHPPLGKYLIGLGIWLHGQFEPFGYRWLNALVGSGLPLLVAGIAYQLSRRRSYALIAGLLAAADGLLLVESRYALINVYLLLFGLLGHWLFLIGLGQKGLPRWRFPLGRQSRTLLLAAVCLGGSIAVKWSGLGFLLGLYLTWLAAIALGYLGRRSSRDAMAHPPLLNLRQLNPIFMLLGIPAIVAVVYGLVAIPHLQQNPGIGFWELQKQMLGYHEAIGPKAHPYCSPWYSWPLLLRPISYFYQQARTLTESMPVLGPPLPSGAAKVVYSVYATGNPILWWCSTLVMLGLLVFLLRQIWQRITNGSESAKGLPNDLWIPLYLVLNYAANLLPWAKVSRCLFLYHYMPAAIFSFLGLAWVCDRALSSRQAWQRGLGVTVIFAVLIAFVFWLPVYLGLPISPQQFSWRILFYPAAQKEFPTWLQNWIPNWL
jgi:dolichyl-phosphate-mannose-protein mannosyltransferase